ncbi:hypothetical protein GLW07_00400 [Bacillus hwajinpoensis]|uniref:PepSY domain-containing protein n=1 Tax=Guptibacillus hwajinpoensis TaxID=208199 RepID=A0A845ETK6_9BACL|nr:hypothetical protein [Pseudalkalibacillus hwajinpoensis]MYL61803.1 hypothetical protein [Pseudalkalibacillus hwajinpoensis]
MNRHFFLIILILFAVLGLVSCSSDRINQVVSKSTVEDKISEQEGRLSRDDAEVLIYEQLTSEEQKTYTVDFVKEEQSFYYIRVYDGQQHVIKKFTVNSETEEVKQVD